MSPPKARTPKRRVGRGLISLDDYSSPPLKSAIKSVFRNRKRAPSLKSSHSASTTTSIESTSNMPPVPVVSSHSPQEDTTECPVCLEPLSFSFRLPGEKPHIVPECSHALHEVCPSFSLFFIPIYLSISRLASPRSMVLPRVESCLTIQI